LLLILIGAEAALWRTSRPRWRGLLLTAGAAALPLAYYVILGRADLSWRLASEAGHRTWPLWIIVLSLLPLALPGLLAYRRRPGNFLAAAVRMWPPAAIVALLVDELFRADGEVHVLLGLSVPLAILAWEGVRSLSLQPPRAIAVLAVALLVVVPPVYEQLRTARKTVQSVYDGTDANFIRTDENDALEYLADTPGPGGVLTSPYLGTAVPARTGRSTWVGNLFWTHDFFARAIATHELFKGLSPRATVMMVRATGARFVLADCQPHADLAPRLARILVARHSFGCAKVFEVQSRRG
jgi:hypothetical protein